MDRKEIWELYDKYLGEKCSKATYNYRIQKGMPPMEAIKPVNREHWHPEGVIVSKRFQSEMEWYHNQPGEKASRQRFYQRLYNGYPKEEAILPTFGLHKKKDRKEAERKPGYIRPKTPIIKQEKTDTDIKIKYQKAEADIIRREYEKMIDELEYEWRASDDPIEAKEISDRIDKLKSEYKTFCLINY